MRRRGTEHQSGSTDLLSPKSTLIRGYNRDRPGPYSIKWARGHHASFREMPGEAGRGCGEHGRAWAGVAEVVS